MSIRPPSVRLPAIIGRGRTCAVARGGIRSIARRLFMARIPIEMPRMGYDMETGTIAAWTKQVGDTVARGDVLAEIETEKSTVEMKSRTN